MGKILTLLTALALIAIAGAHGALLVRLALHKPRWRALIAFAVPPLAPYWGWRQGMRTLVYVWGAALALYTFGVAVILR